MPSPTPKPYKPTPYDIYLNKRSYINDTAETSAEQKALKAELAKLDAEYKKNPQALAKKITNESKAWENKIKAEQEKIAAAKAAAKTKAPTGAAAVEALKKQVSPSGVASAEAKARAAIEKKYPGLYIPTTRIAKSPDAARSANVMKLNK